VVSSLDNQHLKFEILGCKRPQNRLCHLLNVQCMSFMSFTYPVHCGHLCFTAGVDDENKKNVFWCTRTSQYEKVTREAIRKMFYGMKPQISEDGSARVPQSNFLQSVSGVAANKTERKLLMKAGVL